MLGKLSNRLNLLLLIIPYAISAQTGRPAINAIVNAASYGSGAISPGEMVVIFGSSMGPSSLVQGQLNSAGDLATMLDGVAVTINSGAAPLVYVSASQIAAIVPFGTIVGSASVQVSYQGVASAALRVAVAAAAPGIFSANSSGTGQAAMTNADGSINALSHPASPGAYVTFYVTGGGQTIPASFDGAIATAAASLELPVSVTIGGQSAKVLYAGAAPGEVNGIAQINAVIPATLSAGGNVALLVQVGGISTQTGVTVAVTGVAASAKRTVFLIHGLGQGSGDMASLSAALSNGKYGLDPTRFNIDSTFDWSKCAIANVSKPCPSNCSIEEGAGELATHIAQLPPGHIILVGFSMGGLLARDLMVNNWNQVLNQHPVDALVTLDSPNVGYPAEAIDDLFSCTELITEMTSDWRSAQAKNEVFQSTYLYQLNSAWTSKPLATSPLPWLAVAGTSCSNPIRDSVLNTGCRDSSPYSDGVVCADSSSFNITGTNLPTVRWSGQEYSHTHASILNTPVSGSLFGGCNMLNYTPIYQPTAPSDLLQELQGFINSH